MVSGDIVPVPVRPAELEAVAATTGGTAFEAQTGNELAEAYDASAHMHLRDWDPTQDWGQFYEVFGGAIHTGGDLHINHLQSPAV